MRVRCSRGSARLVLSAVLAGVLAAGLNGGCTKDFSDPGQWCGNGRIEAGEQCDDGNADAGDGCGEACLVEPGWLCDGEPSLCSDDCGNGVLDPGEGCDDGNHAATDGCDPLCMLETGWECSGEPSLCAPQCGDSLLVGGEDCDGANVPITLCAALNLGDGTTSCTAQCTYDVSGCSLQAECGNARVEYPESCDGTELGGASCVTQGYHSGELACRSDCLDFDSSGCEGICGDGRIDGEEPCDGLDLGGQTCASLGLGSGGLACAADCSGLDASGCSDSVCGDGIISGAEACDGTNLGGVTCQTFGFDSGTLTCTADCANQVTDDCRNVWLGTLDSATDVVLANWLALQSAPTDVPIEVTIPTDTGAIIGATTTGNGALSTGDLSGYTGGVTLHVFGEIHGAGGTPSSPDGGHAIEITDGAHLVINNYGAIRGGGGAGGVGGSGGSGDNPNWSSLGCSPNSPDTYWQNYYNNMTRVLYNDHVEWSQGTDANLMFKVDGSVYWKRNTSTCINNPGTDVRLGLYRATSLGSCSGANGGSGGNGRGYNQSDGNGLPGGSGAHSRCGDGGNGGAGGTWGADGTDGNPGGSGQVHAAYNLSQSNGGAAGVAGGTAGYAIRIPPNSGGSYTLNDFNGIIQGATD